MEASRSYSDIYLNGESKITVAHPPLAVERKLPRDQFRQVHRRYILNLNHINAFVGNSARVGNELFLISDSYRKDLYALSDFLEDLKVNVGKEGNEG